ncbi:hypothetical protein [Thalassobacillus devorans]|uniref:hypothetical protein n=1 Tax=Thalassobacillus devorans TaxID=279813 RepID=UPI000A1CB898|nr:hypothetical protein [Thalassobacillus devorans]
MKKPMISLISASIIFSGFSPSLTNVVSAEEHDNNPSVNVEQQKEGIAYDEKTISDKLRETSTFALVLPYKEGIVEVPEGYVVSLITNPQTNLSFYKIESQVQVQGLKKTAIVYAFRYGGKALSTVLDVVSDSTAKYVKKNSGKIADAIDDASTMIHGEIYQSLLSAGVPTFYARNIAWAIDAFLL